MPTTPLFDSLTYEPGEEPSLDVHPESRAAPLVASLSSAEDPVYLTQSHSLL